MGELIWAMTTCHPDVAFASVKLSQSNLCPHKIHYHGLKHELKYLYSTWDDGSIFGNHPHVSPSRKGLSLPFTATGLTFFWKTILNTMPQSHTHMLIPIELLVSKQDDLLVVHAYALPVVQLHKKQNFNQRLLVL